MPRTMTSRVNATDSSSVWPASTEMTAAIAPSVDTSGATRDTWPMRSAEYVAMSPATLPTPASTSQTSADPCRLEGTPTAAASGRGDDQADEHDPGHHRHRLDEAART